MLSLNKCNSSILPWGPIDQVRRVDQVVQGRQAGDPLSHGAAERQHAAGAHHGGAAEMTQQIVGVDKGFDAHNAICAPPSRSAIIRFAVSVVTCKQAATRIPASG